MIKILTSLFDRLGKDCLDDDVYLENVDLEAGKAIPPDEMDSRFKNLFVDFADYDFLDGTDIEKIQKMKDGSEKKAMQKRFERMYKVNTNEEFLELLRDEMDGLDD